MKKKDNKFSLTKEQMKSVAPLVSKYVSENLEVEAGNLQIELLIEYFVETAGIYCYNKAVEDCMEYMSRQAEDMFILFKEEKFK